MGSRWDLRDLLAEPPVLSDGSDTGDEGHGFQRYPGELRERAQELKAGRA